MKPSKKFNTTGVCVPGIHYMVDTSAANRQIIEKYIVPGEYFTINRARQYGKTTTLELLCRQLGEDYLVLDISFEAADEYPSRSDAWTGNGFQKAVRLLRLENNTLF
ncbi:MAG: hypothetical protein LUI87_19410 [Lachnospiraceae bacterium]|nr:hypothetical protein [Lachnospiraceae bacterium]